MASGTKFLKPILINHLNLRKEPPNLICDHRRILPLVIYQRRPPFYSGFNPVADRDSLVLVSDVEAESWWETQTRETLNKEAIRPRSFSD